MIIHDVELERLCREEALIVGWEPDLINPASIDVRLGERLMIEDPKHPNLEILGISKRTKEDPYWLQPGAFVLAETIEIFNMPENVAMAFDRGSGDLIRLSDCAVGLLAADDSRIYWTCGDTLHWVNLSR